MVAKSKAEPKKEQLSAKNVLSLFGKLEKEKDIHAIELRPKDEGDFLFAGTLSLSLVMGGGYYGGQVFQIYGPPGSSKSTLTYSAAAALHRQGIPTVFFDHEGTTDAAYIDTLGMDRSNKDPLMRYYRPKSGNDTYEMLINVCEQLPDKHSGLPQLVVFIDSVATMAERNEFELSNSKRPAVRAAMHSKYWGMLKGTLTRKHVSLVATNQVRSNVGNPYQNPESIPGGNAWQFATDNLVRVGRGKQLELPDGGIFQVTKFKTHKNKNFIPIQEAEIHLHLGQGYDPASDAIFFGRSAGYIVKEAKGFTVVGLDKFANGAKIDGKYPSPAALEAVIRKQHADGTDTFYKACQAALLSGEAVKQYRNSKDKTKASDDEDVGLTSQKTTSAKSLHEGDEEPVDEELEALEAAEEAEEPVKAKPVETDAAEEDEPETPPKIGKQRKQAKPDKPTANPSKPTPKKPAKTTKKSKNDW